MKKTLMLITMIFFIGCCLQAQNIRVAESEKKDREDTTETVLLPLGGRIESLPKQLEGKWILKSGIKKTKPAVDMLEKKMENEKIERDNAMSRDGQINPANSVTPAQKDNIHKPEKPNISFYGLNATFSGFTGCNHYSGRLHFQSGKLVLEAAAAATKMACLGEYDENAFLQTLNKVNGYKASDRRLELLSGTKVLLVFTK